MWLSASSSTRSFCSAATSLFICTTRRSSPSKLQVDTGDVHIFNLFLREKNVEPAVLLCLLWLSTNGIAFLLQKHQAEISWQSLNQIFNSEERLQMAKHSPNCDVGIYTQTTGRTCPSFWILEKKGCLRHGKGQAETKPLRHHTANVRSCRDWLHSNEAEQQSRCPKFTVNAKQ